MDHLKVTVVCLVVEPPDTEVTSQLRGSLGLEGLCAVGRLAVAVLRAGDRVVVGEEVRQRTQPRHNSASADRSCREPSASLLHCLLLPLNQPRLNPLETMHVQKRLGGGEG